MRKLESDQTAAIGGLSESAGDVPAVTASPATGKGKKARKRRAKGKTGFVTEGCNEQVEHR